MDKDEKELNNIKNEIKDMERKVELVKNLSDVKAYFSIKEEYDKLKQEEIDKYIKIKHKFYDRCKHLYICTNYEYDVLKNKKYFDFGCIKCGLETKYDNIDDSLLSLDQKIIKYYMMVKCVSGKVSMDSICDLDLARAIFKRLQEVYPYEDEDKLIKYFEIALLHMRIDSNDERKKSRIKRLNLNDDFDRW